MRGSGRDTLSGGEGHDVLSGDRVWPGIAGCVFYAR
jgi:hypothetical protein